MTTIAFCTALLCILAQITIPIPLVPITLQTLAVALVASILTPKQSVLVIVTYLAMGAIGLPVFSNFTSGFGILFGPTGGFLWSFPLMAYMISAGSHYFSYQKFAFISVHLSAMLLNLILGCIWLKYIINISWSAALATGFTPFIIVGIVKVLIVVPLALAIRERLLKAKLLPY